MDASIFVIEKRVSYPSLKSLLARHLDDTPDKQCINSLMLFSVKTVLTSEFQKRYPLDDCEVQSMERINSSFNKSRVSHMSLKSLLALHLDKISDKDSKSLLYVVIYEKLF